MSAANKREIIQLDRPNSPAALTPMEMLGQAIASGADVSVLEKLMALQERWQTGQARTAFDAAIAKAKAEIPVIVKNRRVGYASRKSSDVVDYDYEDLGQIAKTIDPILSKHGLSYRFRSTQEGNMVRVTCIVSHQDGHTEETTLSAPADTSGAKNAHQAIGSAVTYLQRYTLKLALGLAAAKDDDAQAAGPSSGLISSDQHEELLRLADDVEADKAKFCTWLGVPSFAEIPAHKFQMAKAALLKKAKNGNGNH